MSTGVELEKIKKKEEERPKFMMTTNVGGLTEELPFARHKTVDEMIKSTKAKR